MTVRPRHGAWQVEVNYSKALEGYRRVRTQFQGTEAEARAKEAEILDALEVYGKWPVEEGDIPIRERQARKSGNLRVATKVALETHWKDMPSGGKVAVTIWPVVKWFEDRGCLDIEDIDSEDMDALIKWEQAERKNSNSTINHHLSYLSTINKVANKRKPPITLAKMPIERQPVRIQEKWWLRPEDLERATKWLEEERRDPLFADFIRIVAYQGFRTEEAIRLRTRHFTGLDTDEPWVKVPGTKTEKSQGSIAVFELARPTVERCIERCEKHRWELLFPITLGQARERWQEVREFLGVTDVKTATMRALRRTFAHYANLSGMPTRTLQMVLRHSSITTTEMYLHLVGANEAGQAREYMRTVHGKARPVVLENANDNKDPTDAPERSDINKVELREIIAAYRESGATPAEVAAFVKEMMK